MYKQFFIFLSVGVFSALIDITVMQALIYFDHHYLLSTSAGFLLGLVINYIMHANITFRKSSTTLTIMKFSCIVLMNYLITIALVYASLFLLNNTLLGKIISLPLIAINGFLFSKHWIFK